MNEKYSAVMNVDKRGDMPWDQIKKLLAHKVSDDIIPPMINSGMYHVVKFDFAKEDAGCGMDRYYIIAKLSVAREQTVVLPKMEPLSISWGEHSLLRVCVYCGNALTLDRRGGCCACGAPNGGYKN